MKAPIRRRRVVAVALILGLMVGVVAYVSMANGPFKAGSIGYWLAIRAPYIRHYNVPVDARQVEYKRRARDGNSPPMNSLKYATDLSIDEATTQVRMELLRSGVAAEGEEPLMVTAYTMKNPHMQLMSQSEKTPAAEPR